jgi:hypothetical protein
VLGLQYLSDPLASTGSRIAIGRASQAWQVRRWDQIKAQPISLPGMLGFELQTDYLVLQNPQVRKQEM